MWNFLIYVNCVQGAAKIIPSAFIQCASLSCDCQLKILETSEDSQEKCQSHLYYAKCQDPRSIRDKRT